MLKSLVQQDFIETHGLTHELSSSDPHGNFE